MTMTTEVYKGRTVVARTRRDPIAGKLAYTTINGEKVGETFPDMSACWRANSRAIF